MRSSISMTAWLAPPCRGPQRAQMPAEIEAKRFAWLLPTMRTVEVLQFCSWSACRIRSRLRARVRTGLTWYGSAGTENIMWGEFAQYDRSLRGYMNGCPTFFLYEKPAMVIALASSRMILRSRLLSSV